MRHAEFISYLLMQLTKLEQLSKFLGGGDLVLPCWLVHGAIIPPSIFGLKAPV